MVLKRRKTTKDYRHIVLELSMPNFTLLPIKNLLLQYWIYEYQRCAAKNSRLDEIGRASPQIFNIWGDASRASGKGLDT